MTRPLDQNFQHVPREEFIPEQCDIHTRLLCYRLFDEFVQFGDAVEKRSYDEHDRDLDRLEKKSDAAEQLHAGGNHFGSCNHVAAVCILRLPVNPVKRFRHEIQRYLEHVYILVMLGYL